MGIQQMLLAARARGPITAALADLSATGETTFGLESDAYATFNMDGGGTYSMAHLISGSDSGSGSWIFSGNPADFEIQVVLLDSSVATGGSLVDGSTGWATTSVVCEAHQGPAGTGTTYGVWSVEIRNKYTHEVLETATITLVATQV